MKVYAQSALQDQLDKIGDPEGVKFTQSSDVGPFITQILQYALIIAGLVLFGMIISAGFTLLTSGGDPKKTEMGKTRLTHALVGFLIIFAAFWIAQILQVIFNIPILG